MPTSRIRRCVVLAASLGAMAAAAPAAQAVEVKRVERPRADELFVTARAGVADSLNVQQISQNLMRMKSFSSDTITLPANSGCRYLDDAQARRVQQCAEADTWLRATVDLGDRSDAFTYTGGAALIQAGAGDDAVTGYASFGGVNQLAVSATPETTGSSTAIRSTVRCWWATRATTSCAAATGPTASRAASGSTRSTPAAGPTASWSRATTRRTW